MKKLFTLLFFFCSITIAFAQFPPQAPEQGNDAIAANDNRIVGWATGCTVHRGWQNIADTSLGKTSSGSASSVYGAPDINTLSLGDGGYAVVTFAQIIKDIPGPDFAVYENGFINPTNADEAYLELAFVAVSSDGIHYVTFPATSLTQDTEQIDNFTYMNASLINNLAGKYGSGYGTPFDLSELADSPNLDIYNIQYVKITDVVGSIDSQYASYDTQGHIINDPYPSPYPTGGFDLNAIAVLGQGNEGISTPEISNQIQIWPNPAHDFLYFKTPATASLSYAIYALDGRLLLFGKTKSKINISKLSSGTYILKCKSGKELFRSQIFNKR